MKTPLTRAILRQATVATLIAGAALFLGGCATQSASREQSDRSYSYSELHGMMVKLAHETATASTMAPADVVAANP